uniref:Tubulin polyglutamylase TTLL4 n=1 Tax=Acrobeloides nanus TaxID=290746 RepID=A0A914DT35_9BILA
MTSCSSLASTSSDDLKQKEDDLDSGICSMCSLACCLTSTVKCIVRDQNDKDFQNNLRLLSSSSTRGLQPFLRLSKFSNVPPTICFYTKGCKVRKPPQKWNSRLNWCHNSLLPIVMRHSLAASHFKIVDESATWLGYWGRHLKSSQYRKIQPFQKVNHFPGAFHLGRKDRLWQHLEEMMEKHESISFYVMPHTYILPKDAKKLRAYLSTIPARHVILKPPASARGTGITIVSRYKNVPQKTPLIAQHYVERPMIINGAKFDLRLYVYVTCLDPLRIYLYHEGLVRFATVPYSSCQSTYTNQYMHLTNYSINKLAQSDGATDKPVPKWKLSEFWDYLREKGADADSLYANIKDVAVKAVIACESHIRSHQLKYSNFAFTSHELFGMDILIDENLQPWLLEMNISPSLHSGTPLDVSVKAPLAKDVLNICGVTYPSSFDFFDKTLNYRVKNHIQHKSELHIQKEQIHLEHYLLNKEIRADIIENLTDADVRCLIDFEDELVRKGGFELLFPLGEETEHYLHVINSQLYSNLLLTTWQNKQAKDRQHGIENLEKLCHEGYHLAKRVYTESSSDSEGNNI